MIADASLAKFNSYVADVLSGDIVTGKKVRAAVQRHVDDLARVEAGDPSFPYYFDESRVTHVVAFYETVLKHSIGEWAGLPLILEAWQAFFVGCLEGWRRSDDDCRRFRHVYLSVARKNGKSVTAAGRCIYAACADRNPMTGKPESVAQVVLAATKKEQASKIIFAECSRMVGQSGELENLCHVRQSDIEFDNTKSTIFPVGSDRSYHGLNPHLVSVDECHELNHTHEDFYQSMETGGASRMQPLFMITTTAGSDRSYIWLRAFEYASGVVSGQFTDEKWLVLSYEIDEEDDPFDEANWIKANPNLGVSVKTEYLRDQSRYMSVDPMKRNEFIRFHCNRIVSSSARAFPQERWNNAAGELSDWKTADAIGAAVDVGARDDLAALAAVARFKLDGQTDDEGRPLYRYELQTWSYIAEDCHRNLDQPPWSEWLYKDLLKRSKYPLHNLIDDLQTLCRTYYVHSVAYDPYNGQLLAEAVEREGIQIASMPQTTAYFNEPIRDLQGLLNDGRFTHDGNPMLAWAASNAVLITDHQSRLMFTKRESSEKIDPLVAGTMALWRAQKAPNRLTGPLLVY